MKSSGSSGSFKGFAFGEQQSLWIETFSKRKNQKNYYWNVDPNVNNRDRDEVISGYFTIDSKKRRITVREDSDDNAQLSRKDRVIGRGRVPKGYELNNAFGDISFKADAKTRSKNGKSSATFKYYVTIDPSEADLERGLGSVSARIKPSWMLQSDLMGPRDLSVAAFEEMMGG
ncbi:hypothetical protein [Synechococcus sp. PROS-U-1]|uniref:hypothetical protein n=1 Tax=Synechococcus sp. PROS-U-1 TaxID=1400866 RepID=UPI001644665E|nr:hypothetical protein [Synechococcus sp. PROS-U-1]QNJ04567.1 hypothetical protein SynPROSU1_02986 [Synechococcus sp. PROS-U-1]